MNSVLIIISHSPYADARAREALDVALTFAALGQSVSLLLTQDAPALLLKQQNPETLAQKNLAKLCTALPMYDIENLYADSAALQALGLQQEQLVMPITPVNTIEIANMVRQHALVLRF